LTWVAAGLSRPNTGAWLVCNGTASDGSTEQEVWVNLGNYGYMTPAGCTDTTLSELIARNEVESWSKD
jgi:hypothetical protein